VASGGLGDLLGQGVLGDHAARACDSLLDDLGGLVHITVGCLGHLLGQGFLGYVAPGDDGPLLLQARLVAVALIGLGLLLGLAFLLYVASVGRGALSAPSFLRHLAATPSDRVLDDVGDLVHIAAGDLGHLFGQGLLVDVA